MKSILVIPTLNRLDSLQKTLYSIKTSNLPKECEIVVIDQ